MQNFNFCKDPAKDVLRSIFQNGYRADFIRHTGAWSVHLVPIGLNVSDSDKAYGGTATTKDLALAKAVSEFVERQAMGEFFEKNPNSQIFDSTGFAARPLKGMVKFVKYQVRFTAMYEAMERYFGHFWWENMNIGHRINILENLRFWPQLQLDLDDIFQQVLLIEVKTSGLEDVLILIGMLPEKGFVVGCAAGFAWDRSKTIYRASVELMRHHSIITHIHDRKESPSSNYSQKLIYLASGILDEALRSRLSKVGSKACQPPKIAFDQSISHRFSELYYVHRFVFENQPDILSNYENIII